MKQLAPGWGKAMRLALLVAALLALYVLAVARHDERARIRDQSVKLTPGCAEKLARYGLAAGSAYS